MRRGRVQPPLGPARWDCRQICVGGGQGPATAHPAWVIIGSLVSLPGLRPGAQARPGWAPQIAAPVPALCVVRLSAIGAMAQAPPPSTWVALKPLPHQGRSAIFALAVDPANNQVVIAGNSAGAFLRSTDGATTWTQVYTGKATPTVIVFSPFKT